MTIQMKKTGMTVQNALIKINVTNLQFYLWTDYTILF